MRNFASLGLLGAAALVAAASDVHDLKQATFKSFLNENDLVLAEFFAPWCGHCKALAPEYEEAATSLKDKKIALAKIDCTEEAELCKDHGVEGYPTLKVFRGPESSTPYPGPRKAQAIISYMVKQSMPAVSIVDAKTIEEFKTQDKIVVVGYFAKDDKTTNSTFSALADTLRDSYLFGATNDATLAKAEGVEQPAVVLYKTFDEGKNIYSDKIDNDSLAKFITTAATPLIGEVGPETYAGYMSAGVPLGYIFAEEASERKSLSADLKAVAEKFKGKVSFATIDAKAFGQHAGNLNLEAGKFPAFAIQDVLKNLKFPYTGKSVDAAGIEAFVSDYVNGKLEPSIKSEPIPEKQEGAVTVIVAKNYQEIVMDDKKDVLVEFYAPWCGHCKALAPKYEELAAMYASNKDKIVVAKVDATANDVPDEIQGFPTIKMYPAGKKDAAIEYSGSRTIEDLAKFIRDSGTHKIDALSKVPAGERAAEEEEEEEDSDVDDIARATDDMPQQAVAATETAADGIGAKIVSKVSEAADAMITAMLDDDEGAAEHDEL